MCNTRPILCCRIVSFAGIRRTSHLPHQPVGDQRCRPGPAYRGEPPDPDSLEGRGHRKAPLPGGCPQLRRGAEAHAGGARRAARGRGVRAGSSPGSGRVTGTGRRRFGRPAGRAGFISRSARATPETADRSCGWRAVGHGRRRGGAAAAQPFLLHQRAGTSGGRSRRVADSDSAFRQLHGRTVGV